MMPIGTMAGFMLGAVVTYVMPKKYESSATLEVRPPVHKGFPGARTNPAFLPTEMEKIKSRNTLVKTADALDLVNRWGMDRESVVSVLREIVQTLNIRGTDLIHIRVRHTNKEDARDIAAEVARAYRDYKMELESKSVEKGVNELKRAVRKQEDKVEERRRNLGKLITPDRSNPVHSDLEKARLFQDYMDAKRDYETDLALLENMKLHLVTDGIGRNVSAGAVVVHEDPVISDSPVSPNVTLNLVIGAVGGFLFSPFLALPLMWMLNRRDGRDDLSEPSGSV